jgi:hypothetical protein
MFVPNQADLYLINSSEINADAYGRAQKDKAKCSDAICLKINFLYATL